MALDKEAYTFVTKSQIGHLRGYMLPYHIFIFLYLKQKFQMYSSWSDDLKIITLWKNCKIFTLYENIVLL